MLTPVVGATVPDPRLPSEPSDPIPPPESPPPYPRDPEPYPKYEDVPPTDPVDTHPIEVANHEHRFGDGARDLVDEASWESFPASDPPGRGIA